MRLALKKVRRGSAQPSVKFQYVGPLSAIPRDDLTPPEPFQNPSNLCHVDHEIVREISICCAVRLFIPSSELNYASSIFFPSFLLSFFPSFHYKFPNLFRRYSSPVFSRPKPHIPTKSSLNLQTKFQFAPTPSATFRLPHPSYTGPLHHSPPRPVPLSTKLESPLIEPFPPIPMSFSLLIAY